MVEETWRKALRERGREWVQAELRRRPGRPEDTLYDVVFEEPFPTRQFCLNWCAEQDNRLLHFPGTTIAAIGVFLLLAVCTFKAFQATDRARCAAAQAASINRSKPPYPAATIERLFRQLAGAGSEQQRGLPQPGRRRRISAST